jgi:GTP-binding protein HflX
VVDLSDPAWPEQRTTVHQILDALGSTAPRRLVANQIDRCPTGEVERAQALESDALFVSATEALGLVHLKTELRQWLDHGPSPGQQAALPLTDHHQGAIPVNGKERNH